MIFNNQIIPNESPTKVDLSKIENRIGKTILEEYKQFLLNYNGGTPQKKFFICEELDSTYVVRHLYSADEVLMVYNNLEHEFSLNELLPICETFGAPIVCISLSEEDYGYIFVYDWDFGVGYVSDSFIGFIDSLEEIPDTP